MGVQMRRRDFFKVVASGVVGVLAAPVVVKKTYGNSAAKSTWWENYYQDWPEANQKLLNDFEKASKNYSFYNTMSRPSGYIVTPYEKG